MTGRLRGLSIMVTGGGSGIGRAAVDAYVAEGGDVTVLERSPAGARRLGAAHGDRVRVVPGDATVTADVDAAVSAATAGSGRLDHVTCCVGVFDHYASVKDLDPDRLCAAAEEMWRGNVISVLLVVNRAYPSLRAANGSVTMTLSAAAFHPEGGGVLYGSSKWALRGVVAHLAKDLGPEVRVNGVAPGGTASTTLRGLASLGQQHTAAGQAAGRSERIRAGNALGVVPEPADHAGAYVYLADPRAARVVTGTVINTDGGR